MHWMVKCRSKPNTDDLRNKTIPAHKAHLDNYRENTWFSGPIFTDDGSSAIGSLRFIEFPDRAAAKAYIDADPYTTEGIFASINIERWEPALTHRQLTYARNEGRVQFIVQARDAANGASLRADLRQAHRDFLDAHADKVIARGPLKSDDGKTVTGSALLLDVADLRQAHRDYLDAHADKVIARGPLKSDDGETVTGSALLLDVADRAEAEALLADEPFNKAGVYESLTVERWIFGHV